MHSQQQVEGVETKAQKLRDASSQDRRYVIFWLLIVAAAVPVRLLHHRHLDNLAQLKV